MKLSANSALRSGSGSLGASRNAIVSALLVIALLIVDSNLPAQSSPNPQGVPDLPSFDVASVKANMTNIFVERPSSNIDLHGAADPPAGGLTVIRNYTLLPLIEFAYDLNETQKKTLSSQANSQYSWLVSDRFDIEARSPEDTNPNLRQMRLMFQSLLATRFGLLAHHHEDRVMKVYALVPIKPGKLGPRIQLHRPNAPACSYEEWNPRIPAPTVQGGLPEECGAFVGLMTSLYGGARYGARDVDFSFIASAFCHPLVNLDRPVIDQTGLSGRYDFYIDWIIQYTPGVMPPNVELLDQARPCRRNEDTVRRRRRHEL